MARETSGTGPAHLCNVPRGRVSGSAAILSPRIEIAINGERAETAGFVDLRPRMLGTWRCATRNPSSSFIVSAGSVKMTGKATRRMH